MIELAAGGRTGAEAARAQAGGGWRPVATVVTLALAVGMVTVPAGIGLLALLGVLR